MCQKSLFGNGKSIKEMYSSSEAKDTLSVKRNTSLEGSILAREFKKIMSTGDMMCLSSQVVEDYVNIFK